MTTYETIFCPHCDHQHECETFSTEYEEDCIDIPEFCESCHDTLVPIGTCDEHKSERQQMGIC